MPLSDLFKLPDQNIEMPTLFIGHGSPVNAIDDNEFTRFLKNFSTKFPKPKAVIIVSAHWETPGTEVLGAESPELIYDFWGFQKELYEIKYPAPGAPVLSKYIAKTYNRTRIDSHRGLDHGAWSLLLHLYPQANIPVLQISLDQNKDFLGHFTWANQLRELRKKGVLIIGSGNLVHNLRQINWNRDAEVFPWAKAFDEKVKTWLETKNWSLLTNPQKEGKLFSLAHPSLEHFIPILYAAGASHQGDQVSFPFEGFQNGSISMRCVMFSSRPR